jgi:protein-disulfide isomerase
MSKQFWGVVVVIVLIFVGIFAFSHKSNGSSTSTNGSPSNHTEGSSPLGVTLVEYGDYQCPYCGQYYPIVKQVQQEYSNRIVFQFRNYPLTQLHQNAFAGARAAEAASLQGKFWQMHDILYEQNDLSQQDTSLATWLNSSNPLTYFDQYAQQLGLNINKFNQDYNSDQVDNTINADMAAGDSAAKAVTGQPIQGTPTFFLDGKVINVNESVSSFESLINAELAKKAGKASTTPSSSSTGSTAQTKSTQSKSNQ